MVVLTLCTVGLLGLLVDRNLERAILPGEPAPLQPGWRGAFAWSPPSSRPTSPPPGPTCRRCAARGEWRSSVADSGIGMSEACCDPLFHMFKRLHDGSQYPGSGVGLAIARKVVERHGGKIWVESGLDRATVVRFTVADAPAEESAAAA